MMIIMVGLLTAWGASAYYRCSDSEVRRYLAIATALMVGWMILVLVKYSSPHPAVSEYAWYLFYVPMLFLPLLSLFGVLRSAALDQMPHAGLLRGVAVGISSVLLVLVLTNQVHGWAFRFDRDGQSAVSDYSYGPLYWAVAAWILLVFLATAAVLVGVARRGLRAAIYVLVGVFVIAAAFSVLYVQRVEVAFTSNMSLVYVLLFTAATEISLQLGVLPSLSWSQATFRALPLDVRVISDGGEDVLRTDQRPALTKQEIRAILSGKGKGEGDGAGGCGGEGEGDGDVTRQTFPVPGGVGLLSTDVRTLRMQTRALREKQSVLRSQNALLERDHQIQSRLAALRYERQFLVDVENRISHAAQAIGALLSSLEQLPASDAVGRTVILEKVRLLISYSKARGRLVLAEHEDGILDPHHFNLLVSQSVSDLRAAGIQSALVNDLRAGISTRVAGALYDCLFDFALATIDCLNPVLLVHMSDQDTEGQVELRVAHACDSTDPMDYRAREATVRSITDQGGKYRVEGDLGERTLIVRMPVVARGSVAEGSPVVGSVPAVERLPAVARGPQ